MHDEEELTGGQRELASVLNGLRPAATGLDASVVMFRAGQASTHRQVRIWQTASAALVACVCAALALRPEPRIETRLVQLPADSPVMAAMETVDADPAPLATPVHLPFARIEVDSHLALCQRLLDEGPDALPSPPPASHSTTMTWETLLDRTTPRLGLLGLWRLPAKRGAL